LIWWYKLNCVNCFPNKKKGVFFLRESIKERRIRPMYQVRDLTKLTVTDLWKEVKSEEEWWGR
jgi:hypothetical protein